MIRNNRPFLTSMSSGTQIKNKHHNYTRRTYKYKINRQLLPTPTAYYTKQIPNLRIRSGWVQVPCCFHNDKNPSLSINLIEGNFRCHACGAKGRDIIAFHIQRYKLNFYSASRSLGILEVSHG